MTLTTDIREQIRSEALALGFDVCRFTRAELPETIGQLIRQAIDDGHHGSMAWMETRIDQRSQPRKLWSDAQTAITLGVNYGPDQNPMERLEMRDRGNISVYAQNEDYHDIIKKRLKQLGRWIGDTFQTELKVFVDTAPVAEKPLSAQAGIGWQGKHTNLVSKDFGSWLFLGVIYTAVIMPKDEPETDHCGSCRACLDICPTDAFPAPYRLDARKCISYLTIEHKGPIDRHYRTPMGNRIYGCDDCLAVCPWNKFAQNAREAKLIARDDLRTPSLAMLSTLDDTSFRELFRKSPVKRIGRDRFIRNVMIAIGNSGDSTLLRSVEPRLQDPSPLVRGMAVWAWHQLGGPEKTLKNLLTDETDIHVLDELKEAIQ